MTCNTGYHVRSRMCDNPEPMNKGANCTGVDYDTKHCDEINCPGNHVHFGVVSKTS